MNGLDKITQRIADDAQAQADAILREGEAQARAITQDWEEKARAESGAILAQGQKAAKERAERLDSMAQMEGRRLLLAAKQEMISQAFDAALEKLLSLPQEEYVELLAKLCVQAAVTGREELIFSPADKEKIGTKVAAKANKLLAEAVAPKLPESATQGKLGAVLETTVNTVTAIAKGTAMLTVSDETRDIKGGFILSGDGVEVNCAFDTLVRLSRPELERQVAQTLFGE